MAKSAQTAQPEKQLPRRTSDQKNGPWMKCIAPMASTSASTASPLATPAPISASISGGSPVVSTRRPMAAIRIVFTQEPGNGDEISADIFEIDQGGKNIKQIGHAELLSSSGSSGVIFQSAQDSPFPLSLVVEQQRFPQSKAANGQGPSQRTLFGIINNLGLFTGEALSQISVQCRIYGKHDGIDSESDSTGGSTVLPSPTPSA